jgi:serine/threonine protein kinase
MLTHLQPYHANIIRYFAVEASPHGLERYYIYLEFCSGCDLLDQLRSFRNSSTAPGPTAPVVFTLHVIVSLAHALAFLHHGLRWKTETTYEDPKEGKAWDAVIHGDIKPDNIFLRHHPNAQVKGLPDVVLGDFGMSQFASQSTGITGTPGYDSPEVRAVADLRDTNPTLYDRKRNARVMTTKSDVYQLGLVMYLMGTGRHFKIGADPAGIELESLEYKGVTGFVALMVWCLQPEAKERPECTSELVDGCLFAVDVLMRKRDGMVAEEVEKLVGAWNIVALGEERR